MAKNEETFDQDFTDNTIVYLLDFSKIPEVSNELTKRGIVTGMWTDKKLDFKKYVIHHNIRLFKLDIAWVGQGTKFSMNGKHKILWTNILI